MNETLTDFVDQLNVLPTVKDFIASSTNEALKWTDLVQDTMYQIVSMHTVNVQHGQSIMKTSKIGRVNNSYQLLQG